MNLQRLEMMFVVYFLRVLPVPASHGRLKEPRYLLGYRIEIDVVETGSCRKTGHGAHLQDTNQKIKRRFRIVQPLGDAHARGAPLQGHDRRRGGVMNPGDWYHPELHVPIRVLLLLNHIR